MNLKKRVTAKNNDFRMDYTAPDLHKQMCHKLIGWLPNTPHEYVIVCIGTDRSTGDALGPLIGSYFSELMPRHMTVYGTLKRPVHATNLPDYMEHIERQHRKAFVIAIDACLGKNDSVGNIITGIGSIKPGAAFNKKLPEIGDVYITGIVNVGGFMEYSVLQNTRLSIVVDMAKKVTAVLNQIDQQLTYGRVPPAMISQKGGASFVVDA